MGALAGFDTGAWFGPRVRVSTILLLFCYRFLPIFPMRSEKFSTDSGGLGLRCACPALFSGPSATSGRCWDLAVRKWKTCLRPMPVAAAQVCPAYVGSHMAVIFGDLATCKPYCTRYVSTFFNLSIFFGLARAMVSTRLSPGNFVCVGRHEALQRWGWTLAQHFRCLSLCGFFWGASYWNSYRQESICESLAVTMRARAVEMHLGISQEPFARKFTGKMPQAKNTTHTLCEPAQSKCTGTFHKSHLHGNLQVKCRRPRTRPTLCAILHNQNAVRHFTRAILY